MRVSVINQKGGVGKTPLALTIARDLGAYLITNDDSVVEESYPDMAMIQSEPVLLDDDIDVVYDFGGFIAPAVLHIIEKSDIVLVPTDKKIDSLQRTVKTILNIEKYNKNIFIVATRWKNEKELNEIKSELSEVVDYPILELKYTTLYEKIVENKKSLLDMERENPLLKKNCELIFNQYKEILKKVKGE